MKNLKIISFKNLTDAGLFLEDKGCNSTVPYIDKLVSDGYYQFKRWHIVIDPNGELKTKPKDSNSPICPYDLMECTAFDSLECKADCATCPRYGNGVRATGAMPMLESVFQHLAMWYKMWRAKK